MAKTLSTNVTNGKAGNSLPVYLININNGQYKWATKDTRTIVGWSGDTYTADRLSRLGVVEMGVRLDEGMGANFVSSFEFYLINLDNYHTTWDDYNMYFVSVEVRIIFADQTSPSWTNAVPIFDGMIYDWKPDLEEIEVKCTSFDKKRHKKIPVNIFNTEDFPNCQDNVIGKPRPLLWGEPTEPDTTYQAGSPALAKAFLVDKFRAIYMVADHLVYADGNAYYYDAALKEFCLFADRTAFTAATTYTTVIGDKQYYKMDSSKCKKISRIALIPSAAISANDFNDAHKINDFSLSTNIVLSKASGSNVVAVLLQDFFVDAKATVKLRREYTWDSAPSSDYVNVQVLENNFDAAIHQYDTKASQVLTDDYAISSYYVGSGMHAVGIRLNFMDASENRSLTVKEIFLEATGVTIDSMPDTIYSSASGRKFGAWIDEGSRANGYDENDLVSCAPYVIESMLRDALGLTSGEISITGFDAAGNTTNGTRKDWKFLVQLTDQQDSMDILDAMLKQVGAFAFENVSGKIQIKPIDFSESSGGTISAATIGIDADNNKTTLKRSLTPLEKVYNSIKVRYRKNPATGNYDAVAYCNQDGYSSTVGSGYQTKCETSYLKYAVERELVFDADFISDDDTAGSMVEFLVDWFANRREVVEFDTSLTHVNLELGDVRLINNGFVNDTYMLIGITHDCETDQIKLKWIEL